MKIFELFATVNLDKRQFDEGAEDVVKTGKKMGECIDKQSKGIKDALSNAFSFSAGSLIADFAKQSVKFLADVAKESIGLASDLDEVQNVVDTTFGAGAGDFNAWAASAKNAFGLSELNAKKFGGTMGAMLKSMGLASDEVMDMSQSLVGLAGDMASFYNLEHEEAFEKIRSGIAGETEPLKQLGINMSVANLEAFAMSQGITKAYESMTQAEQATLRYKYLLSATSDAQRDFSKTSDRHANALRTFWNNMDAKKAQFGQGLLDAVTPAINAINEFLEGNAFEKKISGIEEAENATVAGEDVRLGMAFNTITSIEQMQETQGDAAQDTKEWQAAIKALIQTMPELAQYVDQTTGRIKVSTEALRENAQAVHDVAVYDARKRALESYSQAVVDAETAQLNKLVEIEIKQSEVSEWEKIYSDGLKRISEETGRPIENIDVLLTSGFKSHLDFLKKLSPESAEFIEYMSAVGGSANAARNDLEGLKAEYKTLGDNVDEATQREAIAKKALDDSATAAYKAGDAQRAYELTLDDELATVRAAIEVQGKLEAAMAAVREESRSQAESVVSGFKLMDNTAKMSSADLMSAIESETTYMQQYADNLSAAMAAGLDADLVAQLADGSEQSAAILRGLFDSSGQLVDGNVEALNTAWEARKEAMDAMVESMTTAKSGVDDEIQGLLSDLAALKEEIDQKEELRAAMEGNLDGMTEGIANKTDELTAAAETLRSNMDRILGGMSYSIKVGRISSGGLGFFPGETPAHNAKGLDYVPYNDYLTRLHKGEAVLSAVDADQYRAGAMPSASPSIDYDRMAVSVAAALSGMAVQMDGQTVGNLVTATVSRNIARDAYTGRYGG